MLVTTNLYEELKKSENQNLNKEEVLLILGGYAPYYSHIVTGLAMVKKITKKPGRTGGIELRTGKAIQQDLVSANKKQLTNYFSNLRINFVEKKKRPSQTEKPIYEPLKEYLEESGQYKLVENRAALRKGSKWENADLVAIGYNNLSYHAGVFPKLTGIEVKVDFPTVTDIQQAASYLRYCQSVYLCFFDREYMGKNFEELMNRLRDEGVWDLVTTFQIGLIVAFYAQRRSKKYRFHIVKEAPDNPLDPNIVEEGIDRLLSEGSKAELRKVLQQQILKLIGR